MNIDPQEIISYLLPYLVTAGAYSAEIQSRVAAQEEKGGDTIFHHALSDADLSIQSYLEVVLLAKYPELSYFSEEQGSSLNKKYFTGRSTLEVLLDPVDGTRAYIDGMEFYQIIVTLHDEREITGAVCLMPRRDRCFVATKGGGTFALTLDDIAAGRKGAPVDVRRNTGPILLFNAPELLAKVSKTFEAKDLAQTYLSEPRRYGSTDVLFGKASGFVHKTCQAIDGGALAFLSAEAGALVTDFNGGPVASFRSVESRTLSEVVVGVNPEVHRALLKAVAP